MEIHNLFAISDIVNIVNDYEPTGNRYIHKSDILMVINHVEFIERTDFFYTSINRNTFRLSKVFTVSGVKRLLRTFFNTMDNYDTFKSVGTDMYVFTPLDNNNGVQFYINVLESYYVEPEIVRQVIYNNLFDGGIWNHTIYTYQGRIVLTDEQVSDLNCFLVHEYN